MNNVFNILTFYVLEAGFNEAAAKEFVLKFSQPLTSFLMWAIPIGTVLACLITYVLWLGKDEDAKEQKPVFKSIKNIVSAAVIVYSINTILKIFGF